MSPPLASSEPPAPKAPARADLAGRLRGLSPIAQLGQGDFREVLARTEFRSVAAGTSVLCSEESNDRTSFLLEGSVAVEDAKSTRPFSVTAGDPRAAGPLEGPPSVRAATATTECTIALVPTSLLDVLLRPEPVYQVEELGEADGVDNQLLLLIYEDYARGRLEVPTLPDIAMRIRRAVEDPEVTARAVERVVTADPAVAARLMQVANSPAYAGTLPVESCRDAVTRLGLPTTRDLVTALLLRELFASDCAPLKQTMYALWKHSTHVAAISYEVARACPGFNPDRALLAGLVHDIGALPVLAAAQRYPDKLTDRGVLAAVVTRLRGQVGAMVLRQWSFPDDLVTVALEAEDWNREREQADYCDLVVVAQLFSFVGTPRFSVSPAVAQLSAFERLTRSRGALGPEHVLAVLDQAEVAIDELRFILAGS